MSLVHRVTNPDTEVMVDPGYIGDAAMESLFLAICTENLTPEEKAEMVSEASNYEGVFESQKNIVRLNKEAKLQRAYKTGILQCAAEDGRKEYKKLRTLWKMEAVLFQKLERIYKNKAMARAKTAVRELGKRKPALPKLAASRATATDKKLLGGTNSLLKSGPNKKK